jgi:hypothetical protein
MRNINEWALEALRDRGIRMADDGTLEIEFFKGKKQKVKDLDAAIRQQQHIIDQQMEEQDENTEIGKLMRTFHDHIVSLKKMTKKELTAEKMEAYLSELKTILETMARKKEELRKDGYARLCNVYKMVEKNNLPAANMASFAALDRMRKRWLVNEKVIDKSNSRLAALKNLKA